MRLAGLRRGSQCLVAMAISRYRAWERVRKIAGPSPLLTRSVIDQLLTERLLAWVSACLGRQGPVRWRP